MLLEIDLPSSLQMGLLLCHEYPFWDQQTFLYIQVTAENQPFAAWMVFLQGSTQGSEAASEGPLV